MPGPDLSEIFTDWMARGCSVRAEFVSGHVSVWFTGHVAYHSGIELILRRGNDEMSISLFCGRWRLLDLPDSDFARVVVVTTDAHVPVTLYEARAPEFASLD